MPCICNNEQYCTLFGLCWKYMKCLVYVIIIILNGLNFHGITEILHSLGPYCTRLRLVQYVPRSCNIFWYPIQGHLILYNYIICVFIYLSRYKSKHVLFNLYLSQSNMLIFYSAWLDAVRNVCLSFQCLFWELPGFDQDIYDYYTAPPPCCIIISETSNTL